MLQSSELEATSVSIKPAHDPEETDTTRQNQVHGSHSRCDKDLCHTAPFTEMSTQANPDRGRPVAAGGWDMKVPANVRGFFRGAKKVLKLHGGVSQLGEYTKPTELFMLSGEFYSMHTSSLF
jgi:hypothetical protein